MNRYDYRNRYYESSFRRFIESDSIFGGILLGLMMGILVGIGLFFC